MSQSRTTPALIAGAILTATIVSGSTPTTADETAPEPTIGRIDRFESRDIADRLTGLDAAGSFDRAVTSSVGATDDLQTIGRGPAEPTSLELEKLAIAREAISAAEAAGTRSAAPSDTWTAPPADLEQQKLERQWSLEPRPTPADALDGSRPEGGE